MKSRSHHHHHNHRLPNSDPPDDWVNGSWTVDCLCGVNFDDGEEMVNCDECGVWVHTRCSRYVKADDSFVCDKCKTKNNRANINNDDSEETEVAQLLIELPTKTVRIENTNSHHPGRNSATTRRPPPVRLWAEVPMEDRVHIQGRPGGDPVVFGDSPESVFSPELWKCSGYVPKRFNFRYKEFPCWEEESESPADKGAGVLFSLSKEGPPAEVGGGHDRRKICLKERKNWDSGVEKKEGGSGSSLRPVVAAQPPKRRREDSGASKDRSSRKRGRTGEEVDEKKRTATHSSKTVFTPTSDAKHLASNEDRAPKFPKGEVRSAKNKNLRETLNNEVKSNGTYVKSRWKELSSSDVAVEDCSVGKEPEEGKVGPHRMEVSESSRKIDDSVCSTGDHDDPGEMDLKEKGNGTSVSTHDSLEVSDKNVVKDISKTVEVKEFTAKHSNGDLPREFKLLNSGIKEENVDNNSGSLLNVQSSPHCDANDHAISSDHKSKAPQLNGTKATTSHSSDHKAENVDQSLDAAAIDSHVSKTEQFSNEHCLLKSELEVTEGLMALHKSPTEIHGSCHLEENSKLGGTVSISQRKLLACSGKSVSTTGLIHKSSTEAQHPNPFAKPQNVHDNSNVNARKDRSSQDIRDENLRRTVKDRPKSVANPIPKPLNSSRVSHDSLPKKPIESKDNLLSASAKTSSAANMAGVTSGSGEHQKATLTHIRSSASVLSSSKGEKPNQPNFQPPTKINPNNVPSVCPPIPSSSPAALSDEELALLLHQELNSSPRVPRVPRVRNAGNLPQLSSPSATTLLMKRTSSSGGKDHSLAPKRKYRDGSRDGVRSSRDGADEVKKTDRVSSSHDPKRRDTEYFTEEGSTKREENGSSGMESEKKNAPSTSAATNSGPSSSNEANDRNMSSIRSSPKNASDDDSGAVGGPIHRTLPGLINEIMSKGRRMTYEELCNAVLPHWNNLRKHNGERYAYSSHSQAVLDCLRNRHEWARLVDRGPKTNSSRKRRKTDAEDSEDNDLSKGKPSNQTESKSLESQKEDFPKGKRKARKRRRLALQGKGIKDIRKRRKQDDHRFTDEDFGTSSNSSDDSSSSEDGPRPDGSEASTSSDNGDTI